MTTHLPPRIELDPYRFDDPTWIAAPSAIEARARPGDPKESLPFWEGLRDDRILFQRCQVCRRYTHYPIGGCQWCGGDVGIEEVDGVAEVHTFTPCYLSFGPGNDPPYIVAIVNPRCEPELQLMTNIVNCRISDVRIGMTVQPCIIHDADRALLLYQPM